MEIRLCFTCGGVGYQYTGEVTEDMTMEQVECPDCGGTGVEGGDYE